MGFDPEDAQEPSARVELGALTDAGLTALGGVEGELHSKPCQSERQVAGEVREPPLHPERLKWPEGARGVDGRRVDHARNIHPRHEVCGMNSAG